MLATLETTAKIGKQAKTRMSQQQESNQQQAGYRATAG
jgi:hypothetical protein